MTASHQHGHWALGMWLLWLRSWILNFVWFKFIFKQKWSYFIVQILQRNTSNTKAYCNWFILENWFTLYNGVLRLLGLQRVGHDWATEMNWTELIQRVWLWSTCVMLPGEVIFALKLCDSVWLHLEMTSKHVHLWPWGYKARPCGPSDFSCS